MVVLEIELVAQRGFEAGVKAMNHILCGCDTVGGRPVSRLHCSVQLPRGMSQKRVAQVAIVSLL